MVEGAFKAFGAFLEMAWIGKTVFILDHYSACSGFAAKGKIRLAVVCTISAISSSIVIGKITSIFQGPLSVSHAGYTDHVNNYSYKQGTCQVHRGSVVMVEQSIAKIKTT